MTSDAMKVQVKQLLTGAGLDVHTMDGGMNRWAEKSLPMTTPSGETVQVI